MANIGSLGSTKKLPKRKRDEIHAILEALTTTIESINERLDRGGMARGVSLRPLSNQLQKIASWLQYIYQASNNLKSSQDDIKKDIHELKASINKSVTEAAQVFMRDTRKILELLEMTYSDKDQTKQTPKPAEKAKPSEETKTIMPYILDFEQRLQQIVMILTEETEILKKQNHYLQTKLDGIEVKLDQVLAKLK